MVNQEKHPFEEVSIDLDVTTSDDEVCPPPPPGNSTPTPPFVPLQANIQEWLAFTIPASMFTKAGTQDADKYYSIRALKKTGLGSVAVALYSFMVAIAHTFMYGPEWNDTQLSKQRATKRAKKDQPGPNLTPFEEMIKKNKEITANGRFQDGVPRVVTAFEQVLSETGQVVGLRIHVIVTGQDPEFADKAANMIEELLLHNFTAQGGSYNCGLAFREKFNTVESVFRAYNQLVGKKFECDGDILGLFSLENDLQNFPMVCKAQSDVSNYKTPDGIKFPMPTLVVPFIAGDITPEKLGNISLYCEEVRVSLDEFLPDPSRPMTAEEVRVVCSQAEQAREGVQAGIRTAGNQETNKTEEELLREASFIEFHKHELAKIRKMTNRKARKKALKRFLEGLVNQLNNFHKQDKFENPALKAMARHLESVDCLFKSGTVVSEDLTPLGNFLATISGVSYDVWNSTPGQKQELLHTLLIACLAASDVTDRTESITMRIRGDASKGKSWAKNLATQFLPEGVVFNPTFQSGLSDTIPGIDYDGVIMAFDEEPLSMTDKKVDSGRVNRFKEVATSGRIVVRRTFKHGDEKYIVCQSVIPSKVTQLILSNETGSMDSAVESRILNIELDPKTQTSHEEAMRSANALSPLSIEEKHMIRDNIRTNTALVMFYNTLTSIGAFASPPMQLLNDVYEHIDQVLESKQAFTSNRSTMRSLGHAKAIARPLAVLKAVLEVLWYSQPSAGLDTRRPSAALFEMISQHVFADAQVTIAAISVVSRKMCSEEMAVVVDALFKLRNQADEHVVDGHKWFSFPGLNTKEALARMIASYTQIDKNRVLAIFENLSKRIIPGTNGLNMMRNLQIQKCVAIWSGRRDTRGIQTGEATTSEKSAVGKPSAVNDIVPSPIEIATAFMSGPNTKPRPLVLLTTARALMEDGSCLVTPYLATTNLYRGDSIQIPPLPKEISNHGKAICTQMLGQEPQVRQIRSSEKYGYVCDVDYHAYEDACQEHGYQLPLEVISFKVVEIANEFARQNGNQPMYKMHEYPDVAVAEYRKDLQDRKKRQKDLGAQALPDLLQEQNAYAMTFPSEIMQYFQPDTTTSTPRPNLNVYPLPLESGASSSRAGAQDLCESDIDVD